MVKNPEKDFTWLVEYEWRLEELFRRRPELCGKILIHTSPNALIPPYPLLFVIFIVLSTYRGCSKTY